MKIFGLPIPFTGEGTLETHAKALNHVDTNRGWFPLIRESFAGAWQQNVEVKLDSVLSFHAVFACQTLIASDIAKLRIKLVEQDAGGIWSETTSQSFSPVLRKPNNYQNRIQFIENWVISKLQSGNTYVLKRRDNRQVVTSMYVLDPKLVTPLVADNGDVYYDLQTDHLVGLTASVTVPATEIIHDRFNCFFHPLVGLSPVFAGGLAATQGLAVQKNSTKFFQNGSQPGGILTAPGSIDDTTAARLKAYWDANYSGENAGKVAVLGDGLKYEGKAVTATDSQLIEQLKWSAEVVCSTYHVPPYKIGIGVTPPHTSVQALNIEYYSQCLQVLIEALELCLDEGLGLDTPKAGGKVMGTEFDIENLLRMDSVTQMDVLEKASGVMTIDEKRKKLDLKPTKGGASVYLQQQNFSLEALAKRDASDDPFATTKTPTPAPNPAPEPAPVSGGKEVIPFFAEAEFVGAYVEKKAA
ncbi:phage portal protein [Mesorhizobium sp. ESP-6-4]|uniref:phage portal protein n=1 Tax=Mesorhizobium sp. ESP-6-4 TaxID=2876624 RepID=UPI001CCE5A86|nr:phage portal protein [Mesorhizobium sp. ESP-6-4]MBZ9659781.1 phage portal protein [Mesorhizobium sp. ESP-6-4]